MIQYSWGLKDLDEITGGIRDQLTLFYGDTGTGKTTLSCYVPIMRISKELKEKLGEIPETGKFIIIDGDGGFDIERAKQIWQNNNLDAEEIEKQLKKIEKRAKEEMEIQRELDKRKERAERLISRIKEWI